MRTLSDPIPDPPPPEPVVLFEDNFDGITVGNEWREAPIGGNEENGTNVIDNQLTFIGVGAAVTPVIAESFHGAELSYTVDANAVAQTNDGVVLSVSWGSVYNANVDISPDSVGKTYTVNLDDAFDTFIAGIDFNDPNNTSTPADLEARAQENFAFTFSVHSFTYDNRVYVDDVKVTAPATVNPFLGF